MTEMTTADEANNTLILYLSPQLHHLPSTSAVPDADIISNMSLQLSVQPVSCSGLPASSEPLQSYVVSPITSAVEDGLSHADDAVSASTTRQLDVTAECVEDVVEHHPIDCDGSGFVQNVMTVEPTEAAVSRDQNVGQSKVFSLFQATLSSDVMSLIAAMHCWDVLVTAADACSIQLLHDANASVYIAVGYTLHSFNQLERILQTLWSRVISCHVTAKPQRESSTVHLPADNLVSSPVSAVSVDSSAVSSASLSQMSNSADKCNDVTATTEPVLLTPDTDQQLKSSADCEAPVIGSQLTAGSQQVCCDSNENTAPTEVPCRQFTRSGRPVKSKNLADFVTSDSTVKASPECGLPANKTGLKRRRGRLRGAPANSHSDGTEYLDIVDVTVDSSETSSHQRVNGLCEQRSETSAQDCSSDVSTEPGARKRHRMQGLSSGSLYNGRTRLESREYEQLMPYRFFCTQCSFMSKRQGHMTKHLELHARGVAVLKCSLCTYRTTRTNHLTRHRLQQHSTNCLPCSVDGCTYVASSQRLFQRHLSSRHSSVPASASFPCPVSGCTYTAVTETRLVRHKARHRVVENQLSDAELVERYRCTKCPYETTQREHFRRHVDSVHNNLRPFLCDICGRRFKRHDALLQHSAVHNDQSDARSNIHRCSVCDRTFRSKSHLSDHASIHSSCRSFVCDVCGVAFKTKAVQRKHMLTIHTRPRAHVCVTCGRLFNTSFAMKRHCRMHQLQINAVDVAAVTAATTDAATLYLQPSV